MSTWILAFSLTIGAPIAQVDVNNLGNFTEIAIVLRQVTTSVNSTKFLRVSSDNGVSFFNTSGNYVEIADAGTESNLTTARFNSTAASAARTYFMTINQWNLPNPKMVNSFRANPITLITPASPMNALRVFPSAGNFISGTILIYGR